MDAIAIGPLVMAADRFAVGLGIFVFTASTAMIARRVDTRFDAWSWSVLIGGILAARLGHVMVHWPSFAREPWRIPALWDGGFYWPAAAALICLSILFVLKTMRQRLWSLVPLGLALITGNTAWQLTGGAQAIELPNISVSTFAGEAHSVGVKTNRPRVINLWATWCPPCRREMPMMAEVSASTGGVEFYFANQGEGRNAIAGYLAKEGLEFKTILVDQFSELSQHYGARGLPATLFIDADGVLKHAHLGEISRENFEASIARLTASN